MLWKKESAKVGRRCKYTIYTVFIFVYYVEQVDTTNSVLYCLNLLDGDAERESKRWFELGQEMGIVVVSSEEEEAEEEEDQEVQRLMNKGIEMKRKAVTGTSKMSD